MDGMASRYSVWQTKKRSFNWSHAPSKPGNSDPVVIPIRLRSRKACRRSLNHQPPRLPYRSSCFMRSKPLAVHVPTVPSGRFTSDPIRTATAVALSRSETISYRPMDQHGGVEVSSLRLPDEKWMLRATPSTETLAHWQDVLLFVRYRRCTPVLA
jgi:hypothetical protein